MARSYARITTEIWKNAEFRALSAAAQWLYLLLVTQADISAAGTLPLTVRRWSSLARNVSVQAITEGLGELERCRFLAVDRATEELLIRSFVKWDGGHANSKRRPVILRAALAVSSSALRRILITEFNRVGMPSDALSHGLSDAVSDSPSEGDQVPAHTTAVAALFPLADSPSDSPPDTQSPKYGVVGCYVSGDMPQPATLNPPPSEGEPSSPTIGQRSNVLAKVYTDVVKLSNFPAISSIARKAMTAGYPDTEIAAALSRLATDGRTVTTETLRVELDGRPARAARSTNGTDANIAALLGRTGTEGGQILQLPRGES